MDGSYILVEVQAYDTVTAVRAPEQEENTPVANRFLSASGAERSAASAAPDLRALFEERSGDPGWRRYRLVQRSWRLIANLASEQNRYSHCRRGAAS